MGDWKEIVLGVLIATVSLLYIFFVTMVANHLVGQ